MVQEHQFRPDLYYRLNVFPISVPPLRERQEDIPVLVRYFVQQFARQMKKQFTTIPSEAMEALVRYPWPGNIRELQNFIERAAILSSGPALSVPIPELKRAAVGANGGDGKKAGVATLQTAEREAIRRALKESGGRVSGERGAAAKLGLKRTTLQAKMRKLGISAGA